MVSSGRRIVNLEKSLAVVSRSPTTPTRSLPDVYGRYPFQHPALDGLRNLWDDDSLDSEKIDDSRHLGGKKQLADLADRYRLLSVVRWKPKNVIAVLRSTLLPQRTATNRPTNSQEISSSQDSNLSFLKLFSPLSVLSRYIVVERLQTESFAKGYWTL